MKKKILIYSDCYVFGGSERLMSVLLRSEIVNRDYTLSYAYRSHSIYRKGLQQEYTQDEYRSFYGLPILSNDTLFYLINLLKINFRLKLVLKFPFWILKRIKFYDLYNFVVFYFFVKKHNPDLVHINNGGYPGAFTCFTMAHAAKSAGCKRVVMQVNNQAYKRGGVADERIDRRINGVVDNFITASISAQEKLSENRGIEMDKIMVISNAAPCENITKSKKDICMEFHIPESGYLICEVAFLDERKGQAFLVDAMESIMKQHPNIYNDTYLLLVGSGEDYDKLSKRIKETNTGSHVKLVGYKRDAINYINACDLFVLPSIANEDMPLVILSAMSLKKNIVATDFAGIKEEIEDNISGVLLKPDVHKLSDNLMNAIVKTYTQQYPHMGENAFERYTLMFSQKAYGKKVSTLYLSLMK